ncbi:hypothetical protein EYF80_032209 [Liparis tanakae]|uniref:Uncharacterized protein n=1 Tax=Liparis tanakae TaxID=230148 RepID=A0A4Z2GVE3_9TELE|nr:hypothetical protein EYF80_032209 [Liparis tanakae]
MCRAEGASGTAGGPPGIDGSLCGGSYSPQSPPGFRCHSRGRSTATGNMSCDNSSERFALDPDGHATHIAQ